jgi:hypothetical protein
MDLSVIVLVKPAASGCKLSPDGAAIQFFCLQQETRHALLCYEHARNLEFQFSVLLHQPGSDLSPEPIVSCRRRVARCGHRRLWPPLHVGLASARWLRSKPPKLEATKRHPVGLPQLRFPLANDFVTHPDSLSCDSPPALLDKLVPRRSSSNPFLARWGEAGGAPGSTARHRPGGPGPMPGARGARAPGPKTGRARCTALGGWWSVVRGP